MSQESKLPLISVITVVYNAAKTLEQTMLSVINQSYKNIEYIIIDGGSSDGSIEIIKKHSKYVKYWTSEKDSGIYDAMNKGLQRVQGELVGIINSDDWYEFDAIEKVIEAYRQDPDTDVFHGLLRFIDAGGNLKSIAGHHVSFINTGMIEHPTCFVKLELYNEIGYFNTRYRAAADYDFINRAVSRQAKFCFIENIIASFRLGGITSSDISVQEELKIKYKYGHISKFKLIRWRLLLQILYFIKK